MRLTEHFLSWASQDRGRVLVDSTRGRLEAGDLLDSSQSWAAEIHKAGLGEDRLVALQADDEEGFLCGVLAILSTGSSPLLIESKAHSLQAAHASDQVGARGLVRTSKGSLEIHPRTSSSVRLEGPVLVKMSSGSTGAPRSVFCSEEGVLSDVERLSHVMGFDGADLMLSTLPLEHSYGLSVLALPCLLYGSRLVVPAGGPGSERCLASKVTFFPSTPPVLRAWVDQKAELGPLDSLRMVISAGAPLSLQTARRFRHRFGLPIRAFYGASEIGGMTFDSVGDSAEGGTVGQVIPGVEIAIEPADDSDPEQGVVKARSSSVALRCTPEDTPPSIDSGWYRSSDLACWHGEDLRLLGRASDFVNVGGFKVWPKEVERVLEAMPGIGAAFVGGKPAPAQDIEDLHAVVESDCPPSYRQVRDWCLARLAPHKVPRRVVFVQRMPATDRGKLDKPALRELLDS